MLCSFSVEPKNKNIAIDSPQCGMTLMLQQNNFAKFPNNVISNNFVSTSPNPTNNAAYLNSMLQKAPSGQIHHITGGTKKRKWTNEEDFLLIKAVNTYGAENWNTVAQHIENRTGKQCRERWMSNMSPSLIKESWSPQEDFILIQKQSEFGNKWTLIHKFLPGRSNTAIKNRWKCLCRRNSSNHKQEFKQILNSNSTTNTKTSQVQIPLTNCQESKSEDTSPDIDALFDNVCWNELEASFSL